MEITLAQFWSSLGPGLLKVDVVFHGIEARREVFLDGSRHNAKLSIRYAELQIHSSCRVSHAITAICAVSKSLGSISDMATRVHTWAIDDKPSDVLSRSAFRSEKLAPSAKLSTVRIPLRPTEALLAPLGARDVLPNGRAIHSLILTYKFKVEEAGKHTITLPLLNRCAPHFPFQRFWSWRL
jgi:tripeptidyl-peptidase-2